MKILGVGLNSVSTFLLCLFFVLYYYLLVIALLLVVNVNIALSPSVAADTECVL